MAENEAEEHDYSSSSGKNNECSCSSIPTSSSVLNPCPICLGSVNEESYLDRCFHKFCYNCILHWTKVVAHRHSQPPSSIKCPMCKRENFSIIHGYDGSSFQRHYFNQDFGNSFYFSRVHKYRLQCYYVEPGALSDVLKVSQYWRSSKFLQPNRWLHNWLRRELQALIQEEDVEIIVHHVLGVIDSFRRNGQKSLGGMPELKREELRSLVSQAAKPFLTGRTDRFVNELELFLASGLNIEAYDSVYIRHLGWKVPEIINEDEQGDFHGRTHTPLTPYLYFMDEDSDGND